MVVQARQWESEQGTTNPVPVLGPNPAGKIGALDACWQAFPFKYQPAAVLQPVQVAIVAGHWRQLVTEHEATSPVAVFGPLPEGKTGELVACSQMVPSKYQPLEVSHPVHVV